MIGLGLTLLRRRGGNPRFIIPATGNDANDGKSATTAWASEVPANTALAVANNGITHVIVIGTLYLTAGINWGANARGVTLQGLTPGTKADIRAYKVLSNAAFTQPDSGTYPNVWQTTDTSSRSVLWERGGSNAYDQIWYTHPLGANFAAVASTLNTTPGSFWTDGTTMYFRPLTGNDPVNDGKTYERSRIFAADHAVNIQCQATIRNLMIGGSCVAGANDILDVGGGAYALCLTPTVGTSYIQNCYLYNGAKHNLGLIEGASNSVVVVEDVQAEQASPWTSQTLFVSYATTGTGMRHTYRRCSSTMNAGLPGSMAGQILTVQPVMYNHNTGVGTQFDSITLEECSFPGMTINQGTGFTLGAYTITGTRFGGGTMSDVTMNACRIDRSMAVPANTSSAVRMYNSIITPSVTPTNGGDGTFRAQGTMVLENCTINLDTAPAYSAALLYRFGALNLTFKNNIVKATVLSGADNVGVIHGAVNTDTLVFTRNNYHFGGANFWVSMSYNDGSTTASRKFSQWQTLGFDAGSVVGNALLNADYTPTASSPAIGLSVTALTEDYIGAITPRVTSGAYEYRP